MYTRNSKTIHSSSRSKESKAFSKSTKTRYSPVFHSKVCSTIILSEAIWSKQDLSLRNPACSSVVMYCTSGHLKLVHYKRVITSDSRNQSFTKSCLLISSNVLHFRAPEVSTLQASDNERFAKAKLERIASETSKFDDVGGFYLFASKNDV